MPHVGAPERFVPLAIPIFQIFLRPSLNQVSTWHVVYCPSVIIMESNGTGKGLKDLESSPSSMEMGVQPG